eukprot:g14022.t1
MVIDFSCMTVGGGNTDDVNDCIVVMIRGDGYGGVKTEYGLLIIPIIASLVPLCFKPPTRFSFFYSNLHFFFDIKDCLKNTKVRVTFRLPTMAVFSLNKKSLLELAKSLTVDLAMNKYGAVDLYCLWKEHKSAGTTLNIDDLSIKPSAHVHTVVSSSSSSEANNSIISSVEVQKDDTAASEREPKRHVGMSIFQLRQLRSNCFFPHVL